MLGSILVTGGTGSFGRAFVTSLLKQNLSDRICIYSRGEHAQAEMRQAIPDEGERLRWFIGDVRDQSRLKRAMQGVDVVVHAAALKRIEVGHYNPVEMKATNIDGTVNVIEAVQDAGVKKAVFLSSDKAHQPVSAYGLSKAMAECLFLAANNTVAAEGPRFACTRYGNVWNSNGSVVPVWRKMIEAGAKAVPVTSVNVTRFWMSIDEAVNLVVDTIATMQGGELAIPTLPAYRLGDLVEAFGVKAIVNGLPNWEKLNEAMSEGNNSEYARRMSVAELREKLAEIGFNTSVRQAA